MRIYIITMDDPVQTYNFIKTVIDVKQKNVVGLAISEGDRLTLSKGRSKIEYIFSLFLIMGAKHFFSNSFTTLAFKLKKWFSKIGMAKDPSITTYAEGLGIPTKKIINPNQKEFIEYLKTLNIDIIINQSQSILKKDLLSVPKIGVLNRHNSLLPKNRGRLTPFWVLFKKEKETGVSIHFVNEGLDSGDIIVQKKYAITEKDGFNSIVKKNYEIAPKAMIEALDLLENGFIKFIPNDNALASYNSTPTLKEALRYRKLKN